MLGVTSVVVFTLLAVCGTSALADENADKKIAESASRETRDIMSRELFGHYDLTDLAILNVEDLRSRVPLVPDYGLVMVTLEFAAKRNTTKHPNLNPNMFEPGSAMCQGWLYLHCEFAGHSAARNRNAALRNDDLLKRDIGFFSATLLQVSLEPAVWRLAGIHAPAQPGGAQ